MPTIDCPQADIFKTPSNKIEASDIRIIDPKAGGRQMDVNFDVRPFPDLFRSFNNYKK